MDTGEWLAIIGAIAVTLLAQYVISHSGVSGRLQLARRAQHLATGCLFVAVSESGFLTDTQVTATLSGCSLWFLCVHFARLRFPPLQRFLVTHFSTIARPHEINGGVPGAFFFLLASALCSFFFHKTIFHLGILMLSFGDPAAGIVGTLCHTSAEKTGKSFAGSMAAFLACSLVSAAYANYLQTYRGTGFVVLAGAVGALAERVDVGVDDNLSMPVLACVGLSTLHSLWPSASFFPIHPK